MKIATIIIRSLFGALFVFASVSYFLDLIPQPVATGNLKTFQDGMAASGYLMTLVKSMELICGLAFLSGKFNTLASLVILPISVNILLVHIFVAPEGLAMGLFVFLANVFLIYRHWGNYKTVFTV